MFSAISHHKWVQLSGAQRELAVAFICPNGEALTDDGIRLFFDLIDSHTIEFADEDGPNEHLHVPHVGKPHGQWCLTCEHIDRLVAA